MACVLVRLKDCSVPGFNLLTLQVCIIMIYMLSYLLSLTTNWITVYDECLRGGYPYPSVLPSTLLTHDDGL